MVNPIQTPWDPMKNHQFLAKWCSNHFFLVGGIPTPLKNMTVSWDDEIPNKWKIIKFHGSKPPSSFYPIEPPLIAWKNRWVIPCLIQGRDRPRKGEAISGGGFVARHHGPQPIPRWDTGHKLLLRVAFEPPTGKQKDGKVLLDTTNPPKKDAIFTCFYFF